MRRLIPLLLTVLALTVTTASAQSAKRLSAAQVATAMTTRHAFVQPSVSPKPDVAVLAAAAAAAPSFYLVVLNKPLAGAQGAKGSAKLLTQALQAKDPKATVGLIVNGKLGGASLSYPQERINKALADTGAVAATDPIGALTSFVAAVSKPNKNPATPTTGGGSGGRALWQWAVLALLIGGIVLVVLRIRARSHEQRRRRRGGSIWTAREFHFERLENLASRHAALATETAARNNDPEANDHLGTASARILALRRTLRLVTSPRELRTIASELDAVEWEILWVEHRIADHAPPAPIAPGFPGLCFFSHEHGLGTEAIELRRPDGTIATVYVSPENRLALEHGDAPEVSLVHVSSRMIPWPAAPSWYGAYGWMPDDLPGLEYNGEQIWGIDGPEREHEPPLDEPSGEHEENPVPATATDIIATQDGELAMDGEDPTRAWAADADAAFDAAPEAASLTPEAPKAEPPTVSQQSTPTLPESPDAQFEELDQPAPTGLVVEPAMDEEQDDELFAPPPIPPALEDGEDTMEGLRLPPAGESTLEWDPFTDDPPAAEPRH